MEWFWFLAPELRIHLNIENVQLYVGFEILAT